MTLSTSVVLSSSKYTYSWEPPLEDVCAFPSLGGTTFPCSLWDLDRTALPLRLSPVPGAWVCSLLWWNPLSSVMLNSWQVKVQLQGHTLHIQNGESSYQCCLKMQVKDWEICLLHWSYIKGLFYPLCFKSIYIFLLRRWYPGFLAWFMFMPSLWLIDFSWRNCCFWSLKHA